MDNNWYLKTLGTGPPGANEGLQRQGSIALPRILSQRSVDEVWKYITEEDQHTHNDGGRTNIPQIQKQPTLGDITLQNFLTRGHIQDSSSVSGIPNKNLSVEFQQKPMVSDVLDNINTVPSNRIHGSYLHPNVNGSTTSTYQPRQQPIVSKPHGYGYGKNVAFTSGQVNADGIRDRYKRTRDQSHQENNVTLVQSVAPVPGGAMSVVNTCSPFPVLDGIPKINAGSSVVSRITYNTNVSNSVRDRNKNNGIAEEKKLEKILRRKMKNRESAVRSRAREQTRVMELEAEAEKLRKENSELLKKQEEMQTKLGNRMTNRPRKQLRRTKSDL